MNIGLEKEEEKKSAPKGDRDGKVTPFIKKRTQRDFLMELEEAEEEISLAYKRFKEAQEKRNKILREY